MLQRPSKGTDPIRLQLEVMDDKDLTDYCLSQADVGKSKDNGKSRRKVIDREERDKSSESCH